MMRHWLRQIIPSMFHRRVLLLAGVMLLVLLVLALRVIRLTLAEGEGYSLQAQAALTQRRLIPTVRGRILDRTGRVLAQDAASFDVAVLYPVINGQWAYQQARYAAARANRERWRRLDKVQREELVATYQPAYDQQVEALWQTLCRVGGISRDELEQRKQVVRQRVEQVAASVWLARLQQRKTEEEDEPSLAEIAKPIGEQLAPHALLYNVDNQARADIERLIWQTKNSPGGPPAADQGVWQNVSIEPSWQREYPMEVQSIALDRGFFPGPLRSDQPANLLVEGSCLHILGVLRDIVREDQIAQDRPFRGKNSSAENDIDLGGYLPGDHIGAWGIEKSCEAQLRGLRGQLIDYLDSNQERRTEPVAGQDVVLSIDARLQARVQALLDPARGLMTVQPWSFKGADQSPKLGQPLNGAAVVLDAATSQIVAAVSAPAISLRQWREDRETTWNDTINRPYIFRPVAQPYEPGSTVKPLLLAAAVTAGVIRPDEKIDCEGYLDPHNPYAFRCWIYKEWGQVHGPLTGPEAIAHSCNIFFYTVGRRFGVPRLVDWYDRYGLGRRLGCGLTEEVAGDLPDVRHLTAPHTPATEAEAILMGIGQGPLRWTVVQAVGAYAALARGGQWVAPTFIKSIGGAAPPCHPVALGLNPLGIQEAMEGMDMAVNSPVGTGHHISLLGRELVFNITGVKVWGKSGTATTPDLDAKGQIAHGATVVHSGDHAWFVGMVQKPGSNRPDYVIAVVVEYAGSGGAVAGPIANQILHALRAEGYL